MDLLIAPRVFILGGAAKRQVVVIVGLFKLPDKTRQGCYMQSHGLFRNHTAALIGMTVAFSGIAGAAQ